jgi:predicted RNA-binding Zn-ribbon protein involved in translation (DUF1610 family)
MTELRRDPATARGTRAGNPPEPGVLCWNCRKLMPYDEDHCGSCGAAFGGSTGGAYAGRRVPVREGSRLSDDVRASARSLANLLTDLDRVRDVSTKIAALRSSDDRAALFQCPSCGRFVAEHATSCSCGVRFTESPGTFPCPGCDALVPILEDRCPVCGSLFDEEPAEVNYSCPKCGTPVSADAVRCICGVWFED